MVVKNELEKMGLHVKSAELGEVEIAEELNAQKKKEVNNTLQFFGFELIDDKRSRIIEKIKNIIIELVHNAEEQLSTNFSTYISNELHHDYNYLSNLFSAVEGITIEKYFIAQKIEKVKELLKYDELSLSEIADRMGYSSVAYLSNQFKKETGLTPTFYKSAKLSRKNIEDL